MPPIASQGHHEGAGEGPGCPAGLVQVILLHQVANEFCTRLQNRVLRDGAGYQQGIAIGSACTLRRALLTVPNPPPPPREKSCCSKKRDKSIPWYPAPARHLSGAALEGAGAGPSSAQPRARLSARSFVFCFFLIFFFSPPLFPVGKTFRSILTTGSACPDLLQRYVCGETSWLAELVTVPKTLLQTKTQNPNPAPSFFSSEKLLFEKNYF